MKLLMSLLLVCTCSVLSAATAPSLSVDKSGKCVLNAHDADIKLYGYINEKTKSGSPFFSFEVKKDGKWQSEMVGWCGTGAGSFGLAKKQELKFSTHMSNVKTRPIRVVVNYTDAKGKKQQVVSNEIK